MSVLVEVEGLLVRRGAYPAVEVPHLQVAEGEVLAVIGPNGAGKSTLLLALARLVRPTRGVIRFGGQPIESLPATAYRRQIALVLQEPLLFDRTVFENVALGLRFRGVGRAEQRRRVTGWLERLGIAHLADRRAVHLSGGEARRVSLARAFVLAPRLLLLDEPFAGLDAPTRARLLDELTDLLRETRTTALFVTHDLQEAARLAGRVAVLVEHRLRQVGRLDEVLAAPADPAVAAFVHAKGNGRQLAD